MVLHIDLTVYARGTGGLCPHMPDVAATKRQLCSYLPVGHNPGKMVHTFPMLLPILLFSALEIRIFLRTTPLEKKKVHKRNAMQCGPTQFNSSQNSTPTRNGNEQQTRTLPSEPADARTTVSLHCFATSMGAWTSLLSPTLAPPPPPLAVLLVAVTTAAGVPDWASPSTPSAPESTVSGGLARGSPRRNKSVTPDSSVLPFVHSLAGPACGRRKPRRRRRAAARASRPGAERRCSRASSTVFAERGCGRRVRGACSDGGGMR